MDIIYIKTILNLVKPNNVGYIQHYIPVIHIIVGF